MQLLILLAAVAAFAVLSTEAATCCPKSVYDDAQSTGRALFLPNPSDCPTTTKFICTTGKELSNASTNVAVNTPSNVIATTPDGANTMVDFTCSSSGQWKTAEGVTVEKIYCLA